MDRFFSQTMENRGIDTSSKHSSSRSNNDTDSVNQPSTQTRTRSRITRSSGAGLPHRIDLDVPLIAASPSRTPSLSNTKGATDHIRSTRFSLTSAIPAPSSSIATPTTTTSTRSPSRKPFSPLPLSLFPCKLDLHPSFPLRATPSGSSASSYTLPASLGSRKKSRPVDPIVTEAEASLSLERKGQRKGKKVETRSSTTTQAIISESVESIEHSDMSPMTSTTHLNETTRSAGKVLKGSNVTSKQGRGKKLGEIVSSFRRHETSGSSSSASGAREREREEEMEMTIVSQVIGGSSRDDVFSSGSDRMNHDLLGVGMRETKVEDVESEEDEDEAWETRSPARRLFVGYDSASSPSLNKKPVVKSKLSMMMMDDETSPLRASTSTLNARPTLRPSPRLTTKKSSNGLIATAIAIEKRTWTGRDSPSASPIMSKKFRGAKSPVGLASVGDADVDMRIANLEDELEDEGDKTIVPYDDGNADVHATGFEVWQDETGNNVLASKRGPGYFDLDLESTPSETTVLSSSKRVPPAPKYTADNIRMVGKNKVPFPSSELTIVGEEKGQENIPPPGWLEMLKRLGREEKLKSRSDTQTFDDKFDLLSSPRRGTPSSVSLGDPSGSSLASTPATDRVRKMSSFSSAGPSPVKASTMRGQAAPSPSLPVSPVPMPMGTSGSERIDLEAKATPVPRTRLGSGMKRSLTKSLADLRDAAGLGNGRVLRSGRGRDL